ncbi:MAG: hypothetical protein GWN31_06925, partial [Candidatus Thorarchaeota archaeon]|nr:hypothetical protein [Candidatus Thorarchaeota archaeon]NIW13653.1 hypothetical protein [Candidatus Thorarchaeota archaeon]NIW51754.1 hypothetical protein [Candidatus Korarchaeota archaeon]
MINLGELKHLIKVESNKITSPEEQPRELSLNLARVKKRLNEFKDKIEKIKLYTDENTEITQFYTDEEE